jgi:Membrane-associating domain
MALLGNMVATGKSAAAMQAATNGTLTLSVPSHSNTTLLGSNSTATATYKSHYGNVAIVNFDLFVVAWAMLSLFYLILATVNEAFVFHPVLMLGLDVLNTFWFFIGGVATAAILGVKSCSNQVR